MPPVKTLPSKPKLRRAVMKGINQMDDYMDNSADLEVTKVLVADDDEDLLGYIKFRLEHAGYDVVTASNGEEALRLALEERPSLAVLDVRMPKLDGFQVTRQIRTSAVSEMPVILLTASSEGEDMVAGYEAGADDYLRKPFSAPEELLSSVNEALTRTLARS
jgi:two-component system alkaline phosphatase synthesis response regulator PhoP